MTVRQPIGHTRLPHQRGRGDLPGGDGLGELGLAQRAALLTAFRVIPAHKVLLLGCEVHQLYSIGAAGTAAVSTWRVRCKVPRQIALRSFRCPCEPSRPASHRNRSSVRHSNCQPASFLHRPAQTSSRFALLSSDRQPHEVAQLAGTAPPTDRARLSGDLEEEARPACAVRRCAGRGAVRDEALCFGWIDSRPAKLDEDRSLLLVSPRRPGSDWSRVNKERIALPEAEGRMPVPGRAKSEAAQRDGSWHQWDEAHALTVPPDLTPSLRRGLLECLAAAKRPETRTRRLAEVIAAAQGRRLQTTRTGV